MAREVNFDKLMVVRGLNAGDKVKLTDGSIAEFGRLKQKNFTGTIDGKPFNIPVNMFVEVIEKAEVKILNTQTIDLKKGEKFFIDKNGNALLFIFEKMESGRIIGLNPIDKARTKIDCSLYSGKVSDL